MITVQCLQNKRPTSHSVRNIYYIFTCSACSQKLSESFARTLASASSFAPISMLPTHYKEKKKEITLQLTKICAIVNTYTTMFDSTLTSTDNFCLTLNTFSSNCVPLLTKLQLFAMIF